MKPVKAKPNEATEAIATLNPARKRACITPAEFSSASRETLQTLILTQMNLVSNLQRDIGELVERMAEQMADAKIAEMLLELKNAQEQEPNEP